MGMAASQGRLLMITARLHDVELRAQQLQNAKLQLSTQQDAAYEEYQQALDATTLTMASINGASQSNLVGTFNSIFSIGAARPANMTAGGNSGYILLDSRGRVVLDDDVYEGYNNYLAYNGGDMYMDNAYQFAWYMVEGERYGHWAGPSGSNDDPSALMNAINEVYADHTTEFETMYQNAIEKLDEAYGGHSWANDCPDPNNPTLSAMFARMQYDEAASGAYTEEQKEVFNTLINYFWSHYTQQVFNKLDENAHNADNEPYNSQEFNYYVRIYNAIQEHGGCTSIDDFEEGVAANNSEWLTNMLQSGQLSIELVSIDANGGFNHDGISVSSDVNLSYTPTSQIDSVALAKAEAKYEHAMKTIDKKDKKFDVELNKLDTERTALTKQVESIKKVSDDNIDRTFGIFS